MSPHTEIAPLYALTFWRPWPSAILYAGKNCENRTRPPPRALLGKRIALHAGKRYELAHWPRPVQVTFAGECQTGIVGTALVAGWLDTRRGGHVAVSSGDAPTVERRRAIARLLELNHSQWWAGPVGILFEDVCALEQPIRCNGAQGWWRVPEAEAELVRAQERAAFVRLARAQERAAFVRTNGSASR